MNNCCNSYGQCTQGKDCPARGCSQSKGRDNEALWIKTVSTPPQYFPRVDAPKLLIANVNNEFLLRTLLPVVFAFFVGALTMLLLLLGFTPI